MQSSVAQRRRRQLSLTEERLKEVLEYFPTSGRFRWRMRQGTMNPRGEAGTLMSSGYYRIQVDGVPHYSHRLAWIRIVWPGSTFLASTRRGKSITITEIPRTIASQTYDTSGIRKACGIL